MDEEAIFTMIDLNTLYKEKQLKDFVIDFQNYFPEAFEALYEEMQKFKNRKPLAALFK